MKLTKPHYYDSFRCIAGACPDTCCANWEVVIDADTLEFYRQVPGELGQRLQAAMTELDGEVCFGLQGGRCRLLRPDGLCPIQAELGEEHLCRTCAVYPRFTTEIGARRELGISLSCPEAARLILTASDPLTLVQETTDEPMQSLHELSPELVVTAEMLRSAALALAQDRSLSFPQRCAAIVRLCARVDRAALARRDRHLAKALEEGRAAALVPSQSAGTGGLEHFRAALAGALAQLEYLRPQWQARIAAAAALPLASADWADQCPALPEAWEQLLCYGIVKYFPRAVFDRQIHSAACFAAVLPLLLHQLLSTQDAQDAHTLLQSAWNLSRELEHSEDNMSLLWHTFRSRPFRPEAIAAVFSAL